MKKKDHIACYEAVMRLLQAAISDRAGIPRKTGNQVTATRADGTIPETSLLRSPSRSNPYKLGMNYRMTKPWRRARDARRARCACSARQLFGERSPITATSALPMLLLDDSTLSANGGEYRRWGRSAGTATRRTTTETALTLTNARTGGLTTIAAIKPPKRCQESAPKY